VNLLIRGGLLALAALCLPACNSVTADSIETFNRALSGKVNEIPVAQIRAVTADSLLIKAAGAEALYVKLSSDGGRVNWYGLTEEVQTSHGRITQLLGFKNDALIPLVADDPFATGLMQVTDGTQVLRYVDYPLSYQTGLEQYATYYRGPVENVQILDRVESHQRIDEVIRMPQLNSPGCATAPRTLILAAVCASAGSAAKQHRLTSDAIHVRFMARLRRAAGGSG